jgi:hypothetical protein
MKTKILVLLLFVFGAIGVTTASFPGKSNYFKD